MQLKARFLRWLHCTIHLFSSKPHQCTTISQNYVFCSTITFWVKTKYVGCSCGKEWFRGDLTNMERQILKYLQGFKCICLSSTKCLGIDPECPIHGEELSKE